MTAVSNLPQLWLMVFVFTSLLPSSFQTEFTQPQISRNALSVPEDTAIGHMLVNITDGATDKILTVTYSGSDGVFRVEQVYGQHTWTVVLNATLDYESQFRYRPVFEASGGPGVEATTIPFTLYVDDVNDNPPQFENQPYNADIPEDASIGTTVYTNIEAHDVDTGPGGSFFYQLLAVTQSGRSGDGGKFIINSTTGVVILNGSLDYESTTFYHYSVVAKDRGSPSLNSTTDLFITVKDVQDSPPVFTNLPYIDSVPESTLLNHSVLTVRAVDQDRAIPNAVNYSILHSSCPQLFQVNATSGVLYVARSLDRDSGILKDQTGLCTITLKATEQDGEHVQKGNFTATASATISVTDVNDNAPHFSDTSFSANIAENSPPGTPLLLDSGQQIIVTDIDQDSNSIIDLSLETEADTFELITSSVRSSGSVQLRVKNNTDLNYEAAQDLTVMIRAADSDPMHTATTTVRVSIGNVNEFSPKFESTAYSHSVPEGSSPTTSVLTVNATDGDDGDFGRITYSLSNAQGLFQINNISGEVTVASNQTDRERENHYYMVVVATDGGGRQQTVPLSIDITDINDNPPVFLRNQYDAILDEDKLTFSRPVTVQAEDADEAGTANSDVTYSLGNTKPSGLNSSFHIDPSTGRLSMNHRLDYDTLSFPQSSRGIVELIVIATDAGVPNMSASTSVLVTLIDINDNTPACQNISQPIRILEGSVIGHPVFNVNCSDKDGSAPNNLITYSIESGGYDRFQINPDNGTITVSAELNREQESNYTLVVVARDRAADSKSSSLTLEILITDVNDEIPSFGDKREVRINVNETFHGTLQDMSATDSDLNSALKYNILYDESSGQSGTFQSLNETEIEWWVTINTDTGIVSTQHPLDRTEVQTLMLSIQVNDTNGILHTPQISKAKLMITVLDINNHSPQFSPKGTIHATIRENMGQGTALTFGTSLRAFDLDEGKNSQFEVEIRGPSSAYFEVVPSTVQSSADLVVKVKDASILDYEKNTTLTLQLYAKETQTASRHSSTASIMVNLEDENDNSPEFEHLSYSVNINESLPAGTTVAEVHATDADRSLVFNTITYSLEGAESLFAINSSTGVVTQITNATDYDTLPNTYQLVVLASDRGGRRNSTILMVTLNDINDKSPVFNQDVYDVTLEENAMEFTRSLVVKATDGDEPDTQNSNVSYSIISCNPPALSFNFTMRNQYNGVIEIITPVDFESLTSNRITLTVKAEDHGQPVRSATAQAQITVLDVNDHAPQFAVSSAVATVMENATEGAVVHVFNASDDDGQAPNNEISYRISSGANDQFAVNSSGTLTVSRSLDRERVSSYSLIVLALDRGSPQKTGSTILNITVTDVNDVPPELFKTFDTVSINESTGGVIYTVNASDKDTDHQLYYSIVRTDSSGPYSQQTNLTNLFRMNETTGAIMVKGKLDRETIESATLVVKVQDTKSVTGLQTATGTVVINVLDVNDNPPEFGNHTITAWVEENSGQGVPISMPELVVSDADQGNNARFRLTVTEDMNTTIQVMPQQGLQSTVVLLRVGSNNSMLDYEKNTVLHFQIVAEGIDNPSQRSYCNVTLQINNTNDNFPEFTLPEYTASINESTERGTYVTTVEAHDSDSGILGQVTYSIVGSNTLFSVDNTTGVITTASNASSYDRETISEYYLTLMARDGGMVTTTTRVHITLNDINDEYPTFVRTEYTAFLKENSGSFERRVKVQAIDNDKKGTPNSAVEYHLQDRQWSSNFSLSADGTLSVVSPVDFEKLSNGKINLTVVATDSGEPPLNSSVQIVVTVQDENDCTPVFSKTYQGNVTEGSSSNTDVLTVGATDGDGSAPNNEVFYLIASGGNDRFKINSMTGQITTTADIDREVQASYSLVVEAVDKGSPALTGSATVFIDVLDINDYPPRFSPKEVSVSMEEEKPPGTVVYNFTAVDNDETSDLTYAILWDISTGEDENFKRVNTATLQNAFSIDSASGLISIHRNLDREAMETATLIIVVQDTNAASGTNQTATGTVSVLVRDIDDNAPLFSANHFNASVDENSPDGTPIQTETVISVSDRDKGSNSEFSLSLSSDCLRVSPISARGEATIVISVANSSCFDYETSQSLDFKVFANGTLLSNYTSVNLHIQNVDDNKPHFNQSAYRATIPENTAITKFVTVVHATDNDRDDFNIITYSLQGGDQMFAINNNTGVVTVAKDGLDYENRKQYQLTVEATDNGNLRTTATLIIDVTDVNDEAPQFDRQAYQAFVKENSLQLENEVTVKANDRDEENTPNSNISYRLLPSTYSSNFSVDSTTGQFCVHSALDYERLPDGGEILLTITATDDGSPAITGSVNLTVIVEDENDNQPKFTQNPYHGNITENRKANAVVTQVTASDADKSSPNKDVFYIIESGGNDRFQINSTSGVIFTVVSLDRERTAAYNLTVLAIDRGLIAQTATTTVSITVNNINDDPPQFASPQQTLSVPETNVTGHIIVHLDVTDGDTDANLTYSINWNRSTGLDDRQQPMNTSVLQENFGLVGDTITTGSTHGLDRETVEMATLYVVVIDNNAANGTHQTVTGTVSIQVLDIDDNPPIFSGHTFNSALKENSPVGTQVQLGSVLTVKDIDKGENSTFSITLSNYAKCLDVLPSTARSEATVIISVADPKCFDYENITNMDFEVVATDNGNRNFIERATVHLNITNVNDITPKFTRNNYSTTILENATFPSSVIKVEADDQDCPPYNVVSYSLQGGNDMFNISNGTGEVMVIGELDYELQTQYRLTVEATDDLLRATARLTIFVEDVNDNAPKFLRSSYQAFVIENADSFDNGVRVEATDDDAGEKNKEVRYSLPDNSPWSANFSMNATLGDLVLKSALDFEALSPDANGVIHLVILATDQGSPALTGSVNVTVTVQDENDCTPQFTNSNYSGSIREDCDGGVSVASVRATDCDGSAPNNDVFYLISSGGNDQFKINSSSGEIRTVTRLDREETASYSLVVLAVDRGSPSRTSSVTVTVDVINVNDAPPQFLSTFVTKPVHENLSPGASVYMFSATDGDEDAILFYSLLWNQSSGYNGNQGVMESVLKDAFKINSTTGEVTINQTLDRETLDTAILIVQVKDLKALNSSQTATGTLSIQVQDVDDNPPLFSKSFFNVSLEENSPAGTPLKFEVPMTVNDIDKDDNRFSLSLFNYTDCLEVLPTTARIQTTVLMQVTNESCFDYEQEQTMDFKVRAMPTVNGSNVQWASVQLNIKNQNDERPVFNQSAYVASVHEDAKNSTVITVHATDKDCAPFNKIVYSLQGGDDMFSIGNDTGTVTVSVTNRPLDFETRQQYQLTVEATDSGRMQDTATLTVNVLDVNDNAPQFNRLQYQAYTDENKRTFDREISVTATDEDQGNNSLIQYSISAKSELSDNFTINSTSGQLGISGNGLDFEALPNRTTGVVELNVAACDHGDPPLCSNVSVLITVKDENDHPPVFNQTYYSKTTSEDGTDTYLLTVSASDADGQFPNNKVFYVMSAGGNDKFKINSASGVISRVGKLDSDEQNQYNLTISAIDGGSPAKSTSTTVHVFVTDVNDEPPVFDPDSRVVSVNETNEMNNMNDSGRVLAELWATDPDVNSTLLYDLVLSQSEVFGPNQNRLDISKLQESVDVDPSCGEVKVNTNLNRETISRAILVVNVTDTNAEPGTVQTSTGTLTINVLDVNDHKPQFNKDSYTAEILEGSVQGSVLTIVSGGQINITDSDMGENSVFNVSVEPSQSEYFTAEPSTARSFALVQLRVLNGSILDYETTHNITLTVKAMEMESGDYFSDTVTVTVNIIDVNDNDPVFSNTNYSASIQEGSPRFSNITRIQATDKDSAEFGEVTYSLEGDATMFGINSTTGDVFTKNADLDRETKNIYLMTVVATDGGGRRSGVPLTITVTDANDETPVFQTNYSTNIQENHLTLIPPIVLEARDNDEPGTDNSNVTYQLQNCTPVPCVNFSLDVISGVLTINSTLNFEQTKKVELTVLAEDHGIPPRNSSAFVIIDVQDVNDEDPIFSHTVYNESIPENSPEGTTVGKLFANDSDGSKPNNVVFYVLDSGKGSDKFRINSTTGVVTVGPGAVLDREEDDSFSLRVLASDRGDPPRSTTATLSVLLNDINDEVPVFQNVRETASIYENASIDQVVKVMNASDPDTNSNLVYTWLIGESLATTDRDASVNISKVSKWFTVDNSTGTVTVASPLDREFAEVIVMKIMVNDTNSDTNPQTASATLTINLKDVNDNAPVISSIQSLKVSEATVIGTEVATLTARDADRDQTVTFTILNEGDDFFNISSDGKVRLKTKIDRELTATVNFTVIATDSGSPALSSNYTVYVTVLDANDNNPQFENTSYVFSVPENASVGQIVVIINATDADEGPNANITFDFTDNVNDFVINKTTGAILVSARLDREQKPSYTFGIAALDNPKTDVRRRTTQQITISVIDVNDNHPHFSNLDSPKDSYRAQIDETKKPGDRVINISPGPVEVSDIDEGDNAVVSFFLTSEDDVPFFVMNEATGEVFVNSTIRGHADRYSYIVTVVDHGQPQLNTSANLTIEIIDENINAPYFVGDYSNLPQIPECTAIGKSVTTFQAKDDDRDKRTNGKVQYYFDNTTSNPADLQYFTLNPDTGLLKTAKTFNREQQESFQISVIARDRGVPNQLESKPPLRVTFHISDVNDNPPVFNTTTYNFNVTEERDSADVGAVYALDPDANKRTCYSLGGELASYFDITSSNTTQRAELILTKSLDHEDPQQRSFTLTVTAEDCTGQISNCNTKNVRFDPSTAKVHILVLDINDNPPNFTRPSLTVGVVSTADAGYTIVNLQHYVRDPDTEKNSIHTFHPVGNYTMSEKLKMNFDTSARPLDLSVNGSVSTRSALPGDAEGFFTWRIMANDSAGNATVLLRIYVVGKDRLIKITFFTSVEELRQEQDDIIWDLSEKTGKHFVSDGYEAFEDSSGIDPSKSVLVVHALNDGEEAMDANELMDYLDHEIAATDYMKAMYKLYDIQTYKDSETKATDTKQRTEYILAAVICVLVVAFFITLYLMLNNIRRFKRKLKAATIETYAMSGKPKEPFPGLNTPQTNPIYGKDEEVMQSNIDLDRTSERSNDSLDSNPDFEARTEDMDKDEQEMTLDFYGEDGDQKVTRKMDHYYLEEALAEHDRQNQMSHAHTNGLHLNGIGSGDSRLPQDVPLDKIDFDLEGCESTDI